MAHDTAFHGDPQHYDRTRALPPEVLQAIVDRLVERLPQGEMVLDVGAGSGRFALPLAERGIPVLALDLSPQMLQHLQAKKDRSALFPLPSLGDAMRLPFLDGVFPAIFSVHTLHLVADLESTLDELARVLRPGGLFALGYIDHALQGPVGWTLAAWRRALAERGYDLSQPMWRDYPQVVEALTRRFGQPHTVVAARWQKQVTPAQVLEGVSKRQFTPYWGLPAREHAAVVAELQQHAAHVFGNLDTPRADPRRFVWHFFGSAAAREA